MLNKNKVNLRKKSSAFFMSILGIVVIGMVFFLSSGFIFEEKIPVLNSNIGEQNSVSGSGNIKIESWIYDNNKNEMEVTLVTNGVRSIDSTITFEAFQRNGESSSIEVTTVYEEEGIYVLKIFDIHPQFQQVALDIIKVTENDNVDQPEENDEENSTNKDLLLTLYSDQREVKKGHFEVKTENEYAAYLADVLITQTNNEILENKKLVKKEQKRQNELEKEIAVNKQNMVYETKEEQLETENIINGYQIQIEDSNKRIEEIKARETVLNDKIEKLELRKREIDLSFNGS